MTIDIPCRYYRVYTDPDVPCLETEFHHVERRLPIPVDQAALVLVDVWSTHYIASWFERASRVTQEKIVPVLQAARKVGMCVVHAPAPQVAKRHGASSPSGESAAAASQWPPVAFRGIYRGGEYADFGRKQEPRLQEWYARYQPELDIAQPARPLPNEQIVATGEQLQALLTQRSLLHLFYVGFATNWCVMLRDYGVLAMSGAGYNIILLRDATTGVEFHDTVEGLAATRMAIREIETKHGWSTTSEAFLSACAA